MPEGTQPQNQQVPPEMFDKLANKDQEKTSSSNQQHSNWISKFGHDVWYICGGKLLTRCLNYLFSPSKDDCKSTADKSINIIAEQPSSSNEDQNIAAHAADAENEHITSDMSNKNSANLIQ